MIRSLRNRQNDRREFYKAPKKTQHIIPYQDIYEDGICKIGKNNYSKVFTFTDVNYAIADLDAQNDMQVGYGTILNHLDPLAFWSITVMNCRRTQKEIEEQIYLPANNDNLQGYRDEINQMLNEKVSKKAAFKIYRFITCSIIKNSVDDARRYFDTVEQELTESFATIGSEFSSLNEEETLKVIHDFFRPHEIDFWNYDVDRRKRGDCFKDYVAPYEFTANTDSFKFGEHNYGQGMLVTEYPTSLSDTFIRDLLKLDINICYSINLFPINKDEAIKFINSKEMAAESNIFKFQQRQNKYNNITSVIPFKFAQQRQDIEELHDAINNNDEKIFFVSQTLVHTASSPEELTAQKEKLQGLAREKSMKFDVTKLASRQIECLNTTLPYGLFKLKSDFIPYLTQSVAAYQPFIAKEVYHETGIYCGINKISKDLVMIDRRNFDNGNCFILAVSGSGKSFCIKSQIALLLLKYYKEDNTDFIIIDPDREYSPLVNALGGQNIYLSTSSKTHINPFDINKEYGYNGEDDNGDPIKEKTTFILSLYEQIGEISSTKKSLIGRAVNRIYEPLKKNNFIGEMPTMTDFCNALRDMPEEEAKEIALELEIYSEGALDLFSHRTNVDMNLRIVNYDILDLGSQLEKMGLLILLDNILNKLSKNRFENRTTYIIIDEISLLFGNEYACEFLHKLWKRIRKFGGFATGLIQNVAEVVRNPLAQDMLSNSEFVIMLKQSPKDARVLADMFNISPSEIKYIRNNKAGTGLIRAGTDTLVPFDNIYPKGTKIYSLLSTKPGEVNYAD